MRRTICWITLVLCLSLDSCAFRPGGGRAQERRNQAADAEEQFWRSVEKADVIYVGETHDDPTHHEYELQLVRGLLSRKIRFAIGWEMFDETQQSAIDAWASHKISLDEMLEETDFQNHWGIYSPLYKEILRSTGKASVRNLALNAPPGLTHKIAQGEPLTEEEKSMMPSGFVVDEGGYKNFVAMLGVHPGVQERDLRRFFDAQNEWDQTMATGILGFKRRNPKVKLIVLTGRGHVSGGYGVPLYVKQKADWKQLVLLPRGRSDLSAEQKVI